MRKPTHLLLTLLILVSCGSKSGNDYVDEINKLKQGFSDMEGTSQKAKDQRGKLSKEIEDYISSLKGKELSTSCYLRSITFSGGSETPLPTEFKEIQQSYLDTQAMLNPDKAEFAEIAEKSRVLSDDQKDQNGRTYWIKCRQGKSKPGTFYDITINEGFLSKDEREKFYNIEKLDKLSFSGTISDVDVPFFSNKDNDYRFYLDNDDLWDVVDSEVVKLDRSIFFDFE